MFVKTCVGITACQPIPIRNTWNCQERSPEGLRCYLQEEGGVADVSDAPRDALKSKGRFLEYVW